MQNKLAEPQRNKLAELAFGYGMKPEQARELCRRWREMGDAVSLRRAERLEAGINDVRGMQG